jgi:hypothetical protein
MKILAVTLLMVVLALVMLWNSRRKPATSPARQTPNNPYAGLRDMALNSPREKLGIPAPAKKDEVWGLLMDWGVGNGTVTAVAFADGSASVYLSGGGGFIGGQGNESIRNAAIRAVAVANESKGAGRPTSSFPRPHEGEVFFYFRTESGVLTATASEADLRTGQGGLAPLGNAVQEVITEYRRSQAAR